MSRITGLIPASAQAEAIVLPINPAPPAIRTFIGTEPTGTALGGVEPEDLHRALAHLDLAHLAGHRHRELLHYVDVPRDLVVRQLSRAERAQRVGGQLGRARAQPHPDHELLAVL